jgi:RNA polymerase sigma-70 factor (ECF subfamily)
MQPQASLLGRLSAEPMRPIATIAAKQIEAVAAHHDKNAYAALFDYFRPRLRQYLVNKRLSPEVAEELTQETLLKVWINAHSFSESRGSAANWIFHIARNLWRDRVRREMRACRSYLLDSEESLVGDAEDAYFLYREKIQVNEALAILPSKLSEAIWLAYFEDLSQSQMALRLDIPLGTVKSRLRLAFDKLRERLATPIDEVFEGGGPKLGSVGSDRRRQVRLYGQALATW